MIEKTYIIGGMSCAACSASVERVTKRIKGVKECSVNLTTSKMNVIIETEKDIESEIFAAVEKAGFTITLPKNEKENKQNNAKNNTISIIISFVFCLALLYVSMGNMFFKNLPIPSFFDPNLHPYNYSILQMFLTIPILFLGRKILVNGFKSLFLLHPNMDSLVAIGSASSFIYSIFIILSIPNLTHNVSHELYFESSAVVISFIMLGKHLEHRNKEKTKSAIKKLMSLSPDTAIVLRDNVEFTIKTEQLVLNDIVIIKPGEKIPTDCIVEKGESSVDESMLTGESMPIFKSQGDILTGGSINFDGVLYAKVIRIGDDTTLNKIIKIVEDAQGKKAPISKIADKVAGVFVPIVMCIAVLTAIIWMVISHNTEIALKTFVSVLVIACPCSLGLATPTAIMVGTGLGASNGILIKSGEALQQTSKTQVVIFDKTGTLTYGKMQVVSVISSIDNNEFINKLASIESMSEHPIAKAICKYAQENNIEYNNDFDEFKSISGKGLYAVDNSKNVYFCGNKRLMIENDIDINSLHKTKNIDLDQINTTVYLSKNKEIIGMVLISDTIRKETKDVINTLRKNNIKTVMLTGDNSKIANQVGSQINIDEIHSEVLPDEKAKIVESYKSKGIVMMVGDGINDSPALVTADLGISISNGSDIAIESADIILMNNDLNNILKAIRLSKLTITNIKQNLFWAFLYNCIGIPIASGILYPAFGILLNPMYAGIAMSLSSVCVVLNALRLKTKKLKKEK